MVSACPAIASSTELSTISCTRWCRPRSPVEPMYMPGRLRTASRPSSTWMALASYDLSAWSVWSGIWLGLPESATKRPLWHSTGRIPAPLRAGVRPRRFDSVATSNSVCPSVYRYD